MIIKNKLKTWFNSGDWYFSEDDYGITIFYGVDRQKFNVSFQEVKYGSEKDGSVDTCQMVFSSILFGTKLSKKELIKDSARKFCRKSRGRNGAFGWQITFKLQSQQSKYYELSAGAQRRK